MVSDRDLASLDRVEALLAAASVTRQAFVTAYLDERPAAVTYAAFEDGWVGLYCVTSDPTMRRRGAATQAITSALAWAHEAGATAAYLQVEEDNDAARGLYEHFGFSVLTRYRYLSPRVAL